MLPLFLTGNRTVVDSHLFGKAVLVSPGDNYGVVWNKDLAESEGIAECEGRIKCENLQDMAAGWNWK